MNKTIRFAATGDYLVTRRLPPGDPDFARLAEILRRADARITNLEITLSHREGTPNAFSGGSHLYTTPDRLEDLQAYGFNLVATANNPALDYSADGLLKTLEYLRQYGVTCAGTGENAAAAGAPAYLDTAGGRVALISVVSSLVKAWYPGEQRRDMRGRPGANGLRCQNDIRLSPAQFDTLRDIAATTQVNNLVEMMFDQGFTARPPEGYLPFGFDIYSFPMVFRRVREGEEPGLATYPHPEDMKRLCRTIAGAKKAADFAVVNLHGHEMKGRDIAVSPDFHQLAARAWIDAGADAVVIQGCHQTRGIEIYRGRPIFYSLGNFIFQDNTLAALPQEFYDEHAQDPQETIGEIMARQAENPEWLSSNPLVMTSVFAAWEMAAGQLTGVTLYPIDLGVGEPSWRSGFPALSRDEAILDRVIALSRPYGTEIVKECQRLADGSEVLVGRIVLA